MRQAGCVAVGGRAILIEGEPGAGKTSLALMLIDRGAQLIGDDGVQLHLRDGVLWASPPPHTAGRLEIRNIGLAQLPVTSAPVALVLQISPDAPRYVETAGQTAILGLAIPCLVFDASGEAAAIRAEYAVKMHGLPFP